MTLSSLQPGAIRSLGGQTTVPDDAMARALLEAAAAPLVLLAPGGRVVQANTAFAALVGLEPRELAGRRIDALLEPADGEGIYVDLLRATSPVGRGVATATGQGTVQLNWQGRLVAGSEGLLLCTTGTAAGAPPDAASLAQAQKMESLGTMAGGLAHDFNNLLTAILGFAGLLKLSPELGEESRDHLQHIEQAARRGADIAGRLLAFARGGLARFVTLDLRDVLTETLSLAAPAIPDKITVDCTLPETAAPVEGDFGQLQQAILNILLNARDAMPAGGHVRVALACQAGRAVLSISDEGQGMDETTRARVFEPFFTTKQPGTGTGLGLAIAYGIVRGHKGTIALDSAPGKGSTVRIELPLMSPPAVIAHEAEAGDGDLVLVVDDDDLTRKSISATLASLGYNVVEVASGPLAIDLVAARPARFSAVLLDLVMPGMNGREVFHALTDLRADLPVVVCTGYAADAHIDDTMKRRIAGLLQKPFSADALHDTLQSLGANPARHRR